jgi:hypothetical protein
MTPQTDLEDVVVKKERLAEVLSTPVPSMSSSPRPKRLVKRKRIVIDSDEDEPREEEEYVEETEDELIDLTQDDD